jgi:hypothetical protein
MENKEIQKLAKNTFAVTLFVWALFYINNKEEYAEYYTYGGLGLVLIYLSAFICLSLASSMLMNVQVKKVCMWGGSFWVSLSVVSLVDQLVTAFQVGSSQRVSTAILSFVASIGYAAAIFYIGAVEEN